MFNPTRLTLARMRRRLTGRGLAEASGVSPVTLSRIENGKQQPDEETIGKLVGSLGYPRQYFFESDLDALDSGTVSFRSMRSMSAIERDAALSAGRMALEVFRWLEARFNLPEPDLLTLDQEIDPQAAARALRQYWSLGEKPVGNLVRLLEAKGVRIFSLAENTRKVDAFSFWRDGQPFVFLNTMKTAERSRFDAAHELGHLILHKHGGPTGRDSERAADSFASSFLMPEADVLAHVPYVRGLGQLEVYKRRWGVSLLALVYRLHKLGRLSDWQARSFYIQIGKDHPGTEPNGLERENSAIWQMVLAELWKERTTRHDIADALHLPRDELDALLFGLADNFRDQGPATQGAKFRIV